MTVQTQMEALEALLSTVTAPIFNEAPDRVRELQDQIVDLNEQMNAVQAAADEQQRALSEDEVKQIDELFAKFEEAEAELERRNRLISASSRIAKPAGRKTKPDTVAATPRDTQAAGRWGWTSFGEFASAVKGAVRSSPGSIDPRLISNAPTDFGQEGIGGDGGFAVPPDFRTEIMQKVAGETSLLSRTDMLTSSANQLTIPKDETTAWQTSGGLQAYWEGEGAQITQSKPLLEQTTLRLNKLTALVPVTEELLEDAPALSTYLRRKVPEKFDFKVNDAIINGTGAGMPQGILNAPAKVTVLEESGQAADTIEMANIVNMWSRLYSGCRQNAVWLVNQDIEPQLMTMSFPGTGTAVPVYLPAGGLSASPFAMLLGRPVIPTEACAALGDEGDIILTDLGQYLTAMKTGGIRQDVSMHLYFDYDMSAFRFIMRLAGQSWWSTAITPKNGSLTRSCVVTLEARAG